LRLAIIAALAGCASAQTLRVYSEFRRIGPDGEIVAADSGGAPREILSPALARGAFASYHVVATAPAGYSFTLHIGQNPESTVKVAIYRELDDARSMPDRLQPVELPYTVQPPAEPKPDPPSVYRFLLDLWVPPEAPVRRIRIEAQLNVGEGWVIYPMEARIIATSVPSRQAHASVLPAAAEPADAPALGPLRAYLCRQPLRDGSDGPLTIRKLIRRNAQQDIAVAQELEKQHGAEAVLSGVLKALDTADAKTWCAAQPDRADRGPEWYLRVRDFLYRGPF
jgi:hypothetical protein